MDHNGSRLRDTLAVHRALSDANRLRALTALRDGELCVCQITELLGLAPSTVSKHLLILRQAHLVEMRKKGRWIYYRLADVEKGSVLAGTIRLLSRELVDDPQIGEDRRRLKEILRIDSDNLCQRVQAGQRK